MRKRKHPPQSPLPLFAPSSDWTPPNLANLPSWKGHKRIAVDIETNDPDLRELGVGVRRGGTIVGVSFAIQGEGKGYYLPIGHREGGNLPRDQVLDFLRDQFKSYTGEICGANLMYDMDYLTEEGVNASQVTYRDVQVAAPLLWEHHRSYSLDAIAERAGIPGKDETLLKEAAIAYGAHPKKQLWMLPAKYVGSYAEQDVLCPLELLALQEVQLAQEKLTNIFELECKVQPALLRMIRRGVLIDWDKLDQVETWTIEEENKCYASIREHTGITLSSADIWKASPLARVLKIAGIIVPKTPTGNPSVTKELLANYKGLPVAAAISYARKINKLRTTFAASVRRHATNGRLHCQFNQLRRTKDAEDDDELEGGRFGRVSCSKPNLQQQPAREDFSAFWRSIYIPEPGTLWACDDYSQQEPKMIVHYAALCGCTGAAAAREKYIKDPTTDNHAMTARLVNDLAESEEPTKAQRTPAKIIFLGRAYGMGNGKMARSLGLPTRIVRRNNRTYEAAGTEAQKIIDRFDNKVPFIKELAKLCAQRAESAGQIRTVLGRICHFEQGPNGEYEFTHKALNRLIQGSSADQTKQAIVEGDAAGYYLQLQVHDELDLSVETKQHACGLAEIMENCIDITVPSKIDVEVGPSWGEIH